MMGEVQVSPPLAICYHCMKYSRKYLTYPNNFRVCLECHSKGHTPDASKCQVCIPPHEKPVKGFIDGARI